MPHSTYLRLLHFLQEELFIPKASIAIAQRAIEPEQGFLPLVLWKYGLITLDELDRIYDWLEKA